jgi:hypothetical protein
VTVNAPGNSNYSAPPQVAYSQHDGGHHSGACHGLHGEW